MISANWGELRDFYNLNKLTCKLYYIKFGDRYCVWGRFSERTIVCQDLYEGSEDELDFDNNYKHLCNDSEAARSRIVTCKIGRKYHDRFISFTTSDQDNYDNTDYLDRDFGDVTYTMKDINGNTTLVNNDCKETWIDVEPLFDFEIQGGALDVPANLLGDNNAWEVHCVGAPDIPAEYGGSIIFIANPRIHWKKGKTIVLDSSLNPAQIKYVAGAHATKIRFIIKHPVGAQCDFQLELQMFK